MVVDRFKSKSALTEYLQSAFAFSTSKIKTMFHTNLNSQMEERDISPSELAKTIGVSKVTVYHWRNGNRLPKLMNMIKLCELFHDETSSSKGLAGWDSLVEKVKAPKK